MRPAKAQATMRIRAVLPEPSLFAHMKYGRSARLKNELTQDEKCRNLTRWLKRCW